MCRLVLITVAMFLINYCIKLPFEYSNGIELLIGTIMSAILLDILGFLIYKISFSIAGHFGLLVSATGDEKSILHWSTRVVLYLILFALTYIPFVSTFLTYLVHSTYSLYIKWINEFSDKLLEIYL